MKLKKAFTLVEVTVVVVMLGLILPSFYNMVNYQNKSMAVIEERENAQSNLQTLSIFLKEYLREAKEISLYDDVNDANDAFNKLGDKKNRSIIIYEEDENIFFRYGNNGKRFVGNIKNNIFNKNSKDDSMNITMNIGSGVVENRGFIEYEFLANHIKTPISVSSAVSPLNLDLKDLNNKSGSDKNKGIIITFFDVMRFNELNRNNSNIENAFFVSAVITGQSTENPGQGNAATVDFSKKTVNVFSKDVSKKGALGGIITTGVDHSGIMVDIVDNNGDVAKPTSGYEFSFNFKSSHKDLGYGIMLSGIAEKKDLENELKAGKNQTGYVFCYDPQYGGFSVRKVHQDRRVQISKGSNKEYRNDKNGGPGGFQGIEFVKNYNDVITNKKGDLKLEFAESDNHRCPYLIEDINNDNFKFDWTKNNKTVINTITKKVGVTNTWPEIDIFNMYIEVYLEDEYGNKSNVMKFGHNGNYELNGKTFKGTPLWSNVDTWDRKDDDEGERINTNGQKLSIGSYYSSNGYNVTNKDEYIKEMDRQSMIFENLSVKEYKGSKF